MSANENTNVNPYDSFKNLDLIPVLLKELQEIKERQLKFMPKIDNKKAVMQYLDISQSTYQNYLKDGRFQENVHFYKKNGKMIFIENAIIELKQKRDRGRL